MKLLNVIGILSGAAILVSKSDGAVDQTKPWINELVYDALDDSADGSEWIEIVVPPQYKSKIADLHLYDPRISGPREFDLSAGTVTEIGDYTIIVVSHKNLMSNSGSALAITEGAFDDTNAVILDSLAYEREVTGNAANGILANVVFPEIPEISQVNADTTSCQRSLDDVWACDATATQGQPNAGQSFDGSSPQGPQSFKLRLVHMNDMHSRVEGLTSSESACDDPDTNSTSSICDGGWPRIITAAKQFVSTSDANATIFLEDGDEFMGTLWSSYYRGEEASTFLNMMCDETTGAGFDHCVGTFGNHEFDYGYETLVNYTSQIGFDMISSNINDVCDPINGLTLANQISKNKIIEVDGVKVGIFAYTTPETRDISSPPECVTFEDEITVATAQVAALKAEGANIIIALGHSGYGRDQQILAAVDDIDIVVGGHSHSFLWDEAAQGANPVLSGNAFGIDGGMKTSLNDGYLYPTETENGSLIVQAYWSGRYLGMIDLEFNAAGEITDYTPGTVLVGSDVSTSAAEAKYQFAKDPAAQAKVTEMSGALNEFAGQVIGESAVALDGLRSNVRSKETNLGNLICDAMLDSINSNTAFTATNSPVDLCLMNSGGIRASIDAGDVTIRDVLEVLPFGNVLSVVRMTGAQVYLMIEHGLSRYGNEKGEFGQFGSGFRIEFDPAVEAACGKCDDCDPCATAANIEVTRVKKIRLNDQVIPNDDSQTYNLVTNDFLTRGGDSYQVLTETEVLLGTGAVLDQVVRDYIAAQTNGVSPETECRIYDLASPAPECPFLCEEDLAGVTDVSTGTNIPCSDLTDYCESSPLIGSRCQVTCELCDERPCEDKSDLALERENGDKLTCEDAKLYCNINYVQYACPATCEVCSSSQFVFVDPDLFSSDIPAFEAIPNVESVDEDESSSTVGIILGVICGAAAIGGAAFLYFRKQSLETSSDPKSGETSLVAPQDAENPKYEI